jgi:hypothetical protein
VQQEGTAVVVGAAGAAGGAAKAAGAAGAGAAGAGAGVAGAAAGAAVAAGAAGATQFVLDSFAFYRLQVCEITCGIRQPENGNYGPCRRLCFRQEGAFVSGMWACGPVGLGTEHQ